MGYRVGIQCFETKLQADDYILSQQPPIITQDGQIIRPIRTDTGWYLNNQPIILSYPQCEISQQIHDGALIGTSFALIAVVIFGIRSVIRLILSLTSVGASDDN